MAQDELLSQEEIDALLNGPGGDNTQEQSNGNDNGGQRIRPYDPASQNRIVRERLHGLDIINQRFARKFRVSLFNLIRHSADITIDAVAYQGYRDFVRNVPVPTNLNLVTMKPLRGTALVVFPPDLVFMVVDNLFGGDGRFVTRNEGREFTNTEQRIIQRVLSLVMEAYQECWEPVFKLELAYVRSEVQAKFANITNSPTELIVSTTFHIDVGSLSSHFQICIPYPMIEPLRELLNNPSSGNEDSVDVAWTRRMANEVQDSRVELSVELASIPSHIGKIRDLKVGDVLPIELPKTVTACTDEVPVLECTYGTHNGQRALRVSRVIDHSGPDRAVTPFSRVSPSKTEESTHV